MKPIVISISRDGVHEIMKPFCFSLSRDGVDETRKPGNHKTYQPPNGVHETMKPIVISMSRHGVHREISNETTKPQVLFSNMCHDFSS